MRKLLCILLSCALLCSMTGCSLFSTGSEKGSTTGKSYKLTEDFTHTAPADLEYDKEYAYTSGESQEISDSYMQMYGVACVAEYWFLYANAEDKAIAQYEYFVFNSPEDAETFKNALEEYGYSNMSVEGSVVSIVSDEAAVADLIAMQQQYSGLGEDTASAYAQFYKEGWAYMEIQD